VQSADNDETVKLQQLNIITRSRWLTTAPTFNDTSSIIAIPLVMAAEAFGLLSASSGKFAAMILPPESGHTEEPLTSDAAKP
jgi:hypothetical protein